jgi:hypothetical protein
VVNNPIRFNDPSGHKCAPEDGCEGYTSKGKISMGYWKVKVKQKFGISLTGNWDGQNALIMFDALSTMDNKISGGIARFTTGSIYSFSDDPDHYGGRTNTTNGNISFWTYNKLPYQNIYHEVTHSIDYRTGQYFTSALNSNATYTASGEFVMGGPAATYQRNALGYAETYLMDPIGRRVEAEQHTATSNCSGRPEWCASGNNATEEFADVVANYIADNLITDLTNPYYQYGAARLDWVTNIFAGYPTP